MKEQISTQVLLAYIEKRMDKISQKKVDGALNHISKLSKLNELDKLKSWVLNNVQL